MSRTTKVKPSDIAGDRGNEDFKISVVNEDVAGNVEINQRVAAIADQEILDAWEEQREKCAAPIAKTASFRGIARTRSLMASMLDVGQIERGQKSKNGKTVSGNHREMVCRLLGLTFKFDTLDGDDNDPQTIAIGTDANAETRRDSIGQAIATAVRTRLYHESIWKERPHHLVPTYSTLAQKFGTSEQTVGYARAVFDACPDLLDCIEQNRVKVYRAKELVDALDGSALPRAVAVLQKIRIRDEWNNAADPWEGADDAAANLREFGSASLDDILAKARLRRAKELAAKEKKKREQVAEANEAADRKAAEAAITDLMIKAAMVDPTLMANPVIADPPPPPIVAKPPKPTPEQRAATKAENELTKAQSKLAEAQQKVTAAVDEKSKAKAQKKAAEVAAELSAKDAAAQTARVTAEQAVAKAKERADTDVKAKAAQKLVGLAHDAKQAAYVARQNILEVFAGAVEAQMTADAARVNAEKAVAGAPAAALVKPLEPLTEADDFGAKLLRKFPTVAALIASVENV